MGRCCSLACGHRRISGRRFSSPKWVERSDDRKYVCVRRLAVPKRHNVCSSSSSLATSSTCDHFLRLVDTIPRAPRASLFQILLSTLFKSWYFPTFPQRFLCRRDARYLLWDISLLSCPSLQRQACFCCLSFHCQICLIPLSPTSFYSSRRRELHSRPLYGLYPRDLSEISRGDGGKLGNWEL